MTDEEKAEEYAEDYAVKKLRERNHEVVKVNEAGVDVAYILWHTAEVEQAFKDGAKWGMEHAIEWHDLRENPNDLPKEYGEYQVCYENSLVKGRKEHAIWQYVYDKWEHTARIIAWCELPQFKEKE